MTTSPDAPTTLTRGGNVALPAGPLVVTVAAGSPVDVAALLLNGQGRVRSDADFVFYNQPTGPGVRHRSGPPDGVAVDPAALPREIERVVVTASLDGSGPATFGALGSATVTVAGAGGSVAAIFVADGLTAETAVVLVELYRRGEAWKLRAVGQGWAAGLAGIATSFGITVDEAPVRPPQTAVSPTSTPTSAQAAPASIPTAAAAVNLDKGRVTLAKRQSVSLTKTGAAPLRKVVMGLGWDPARSGRKIDLDASVIAYSADGKDLEKVWFMGKKAFRGAIRHSGDNLTGQGEGDDEQIEVDLEALPAQVNSLLFTVNSFSGQDFTAVARAYCRLLDRDSGTELVRFDLTEAKPRTGVFLCRLTRAGTAWTMTALGEFADGRTVKAMVQPGVALL